MTEFYQGILACATMLGGMCAFIYWVFNLMEKRLELKINHSLASFDSKLDLLSVSVKIIADEVREERKRTDHLYMFVLDSVNKKEKAVKK